MNTVEQEFVSVRMRVSVLKRLLQGHNIHLCDVHGTSAKQKQCLQQLLLQVVSESK